MGSFEDLDISAIREEQREKDRLAAEQRDSVADRLALFIASDIEPLARDFVFKAAEVCPPASLRSNAVPSPEVWAFADFSDGYGYSAGTFYVDAFLHLYELDFEGGRPCLKAASYETLFGTDRLSSDLLTAKQQLLDQLRDRLVSLAKNSSRQGT